MSVLIVEVSSTYCYGCKRHSTSVVLSQMGFLSVCNNVTRWNSSRDFFPLILHQVARNRNTLLYQNKERLYIRFGYIEVVLDNVDVIVIRDLTVFCFRLPGTSYNRIQSEGVFIFLICSKLVLLSDTQTLRFCRLMHPQLYPKMLAFRLSSIFCGLFLSYSASLVMPHEKKSSREVLKAIFCFIEERLCICIFSWSSQNGRLLKGIFSRTLPTSHSSGDLMPGKVQGKLENQNQGLTLTLCSI